MSRFFRPLDTCILCGSSTLDVVVPLKAIPVSSPNSKALAESTSAREQLAPLDLKQCRACGHLQVASMVDPEFLYRNYLYRTAISVGLAQHFGRLTDEVCLRLGLKAGDKVLEIGSNDGTQLAFFKEKGLSVLGVDPGAAIAHAATAAGIETIADFFTESLAFEILAQRGKVQLVVANNVTANIPDLAGVVRGVRAVLAQDGAFVFETQYGADVITGNLLDTVYHEHLSYFLIKPLVAFFANLGMEVIHVLPVPTKGGSIRVTVQHAGAARSVDPVVAAMMAEEARLGLYDAPIYQGLTSRIERNRTDLLAYVDEQRRQGRKVAGYGVSIGTSCLLHQFGLWDKIDFLVDDDLEKEGTLAGPGYEIPVRGPSALAAEQPGAVVVFAWRYTDGIMANQQEYVKKGGRFVTPLPDLAVR